LRADIVNGDHRALYMAWLFCVQMHELKDDEPEPPVPPSLADLNAPLQSFVDFMRIDQDLIAAATENSSSDSGRTDSGFLKTWIHNLPVVEKDDFLFRLVDAPSPHLGAELKQRFLRTISRAANSTTKKSPRSVQELLARAEIITEERERRAAEQNAKELARKKREKAIAREKYLKSLVGREDSTWEKVAALIDSKQPAKYDEAVKLLVDLRDLNKTAGKESAFNAKLQKIREKHHRKPSFLDRLKKAGLRD
jgi:hypothetical protein